MRRLLAACTALVLVLPAQVANATTSRTAKPVRNLAAYELSGPVHLQWTNPSNTDRVLARFAAGRKAPATVSQGHPLGVARLAHTATLRNLKPGTEYSVAVWTKHAGVLSKRTNISFFAKPATRTKPASNGTISGIVTDKSGDPLDNANVYADGGRHFGRTVSDARGRFVLHVPADHYFVIADGAKASGGDSDATGYQSDFRKANLAANGSRSVSLVLADGGAARGQVTDADGAPVRGIAVTYQPPQPYLDPTFSNSSISFAGIEVTHTNSSGHYTLKGLSTAGVVPCFQPRAGYVARCAPSAVAAAPRTTVAVPAAALTVARSGTISGTVSSASKQRLRDLIVEADKVRGNGTAFIEPHSAHFTLAGLSPGRWHVCAFAATRGVLGLLPDCVNRTVAANHTTAADFVLRNAGAISGRVLGPSGHGVPDLELDITHKTKGGSVGSGIGFVSPGGFYTLGGLSTGTYRICFGGNGSTTAPGDPTGVGRRCLSHPVRVVAGRDRIGIDRTLPAGGAITGRITDGAGRSIAGADIDLERLGRGFSFFDATTGSDGRYRITDLAPGHYQACVTAFSNDDIFGPDREQCPRRAITIAAGRTRRGYDLRLPTQPLVHVTVKDSSGHPLSGVEVAALRTCKDQFECPPQPVFGSHPVVVDTVNVTDAHGHAVLRTSRGGHFAVCALSYYAATPTGTSPTGYADKCSASTFNVTASTTTPASVSLSLDDGAVVTGRVTNAQGHGVRGAQMHITGSPTDDIGTPFGFDDLSPDFPSPYNDAITDAHGDYTIHSIQPGQAQVCARNAKGYQDGCLGSDLTLTGGSSTSAPDLQLMPHTGSAPRATTHTTVRRPAWDEVAVGGQVVSRQRASAHAARTVSPFGPAQTSQYEFGQAADRLMAARR